MKMRYVYAIGLAMLLGSCSERDILNNPVSDGDVNSVTFSVKDFEWEGMTRTMAEKTSTGVTFKWTSTDTIGIFPNAGSQVAFPIEAGADAANAIFNGGGWALKENSTYRAYLPYDRFQLDQTRILLDYSDQMQDGNNNIQNVTKRDYLVSSLATPESGIVNFDFKHVGCLVRFVLTVPKDDSFSKFEFIPNNGTPKTMLLDLSNENGSVTEKDLAKKGKFSMTLTNFQTTSDNKIAVIYCMLPPKDYGTEHQVILYGEKGAYSNICQRQLILESGKAYTYNDELSDYSIEDPFNGYEYIDLGLKSGTMWAVCNLGASCPEDPGDFYAFAEVFPKTDFTNESHVYWDDESSSYIKYNSGSGILDIEDDAARYLMGGRWQIPTLQQILELRGVASEWTTRNGVEGQLFRGNGNEMFIPISGHYHNGSTLTYDFASFMSSSYSNQTYYLFAGNEYGYGMPNYGFYSGVPIRAVCVPE